MHQGILAKIAGWAQFGVNLFSQVAANPGQLPHGALGWGALISSLFIAVATHAASNTDGTK